MSTVRELMIAAGVLRPSGSRRTLSERLGLPVVRVDDLGLKDAAALIWALEIGEVKGAQLAARAHELIAQASPAVADALREIARRRGLRLELEAA